VVRVPRIYTLLYTIPFTRPTSPDRHRPFHPNAAHTGVVAVSPRRRTTPHCLTRSEHADANHSATAEIPTGLGFQNYLFGRCSTISTTSSSVATASQPSPSGWRRNRAIHFDISAAERQRERKSNEGGRERYARIRGKRVSSFRCVI
jgi:hypothetical protein